jgi:hypothetical protein
VNNQLQQFRTQHSDRFAHFDTPWQRISNIKFSEKGSHGETVYIGPAAGEDLCLFRTPFSIMDNPLGIGVEIEPKDKT